jgi:DNA-binding NtrC family response regulator
MIKKSTAAPHFVSLGRVPSTTVNPAEIRVLVVDDDNTARAEKIAKLRLDEFDVSEANGIESTLTSLRKSPVDVVVLDMHMPNPDGDENDAGLVVLREIATWELKPNVIVFTVGMSAQQARAARKLGAVALTKARDLRKLPIQVCAAWSDRQDALLGPNGT